ncbi:CoxG family protein [Paraburkholderia sp. GAS82]|uniref:CoxG family protein n=1 Tax=Paraburkholderia sp. GAS82 TaxID=3035137 RepID=UPI003D204B73
MELSGNQLMAAPRSAVWEALLDPAVLQRCIPGCEDVARVSDEETHVRILVKLGPVRARFTGKMFMSEVDPARHCKLSFEGVGGGAGSAKGSSNVELSDEAGGTRLTYSVAASVGGKLGQIGGRLIDSSAKKMADEFFAGLQRQLSGGVIADDAPLVAEATAGPTNAPPSPERRPNTSPSSLWPEGRFAPELARAGWFALGVLTTLLLTHLA